MKLIIDIPKEKLNTIKNKVYCGIYDSDLYNAIANGIPLDDVKAEIGKIPTDYCGGYIGLGKEEVFEILDNIGRK